MDHNDIPYCLGVFGFGVAGVTACVCDLSLLRAVCLGLGLAGIGAAAGMAFLIIIGERSRQTVEQKESERENGCSRIFIGDETENPEWN